jgi:hypothetical protein
MYAEMTNVESVIHSTEISDTNGCGGGDDTRKLKPNPPRRQTPRVIGVSKRNILYMDFKSYFNIFMNIS